MSGLGKRRRVRFILSGIVLLASAAVLFGYAFRDGIQFFRTPSEVAAQPPGPGEIFRIGGMVESGSLIRRGIEVSFRVRDENESVPVFYSGITPDLFREGEGVIATGRLVGGKFVATEILAKHDESYMPRELADMTFE
ncbi:MAG: cytochrome c maturation protein CcmE [Paracoccus sp. (in: a-proteobacteria)]